MKYVITDNQDVILFSEGVPHDRFACFHPDSAGFVDIEPTIPASPSEAPVEIRVRARGKSIGLELCSKERDSILIAIALARNNMGDFRYGTEPDEVIHGR